MIERFSPNNKILLTKSFENLFKVLKILLQKMKIKNKFILNSQIFILETKPSTLLSILTNYIKYWLKQIHNVFKLNKGGKYNEKV